MFPQIAVSYIDSTSCALQIPNADLATLFHQQSAVLVFDILLFFLKKKNRFVFYYPSSALRSLYFP